MPTTILDGETFEEARIRRFREEAEIDARLNSRAKDETMCWQCNAPYPMTDPACPKCNAFNANLTMDGRL